MNHLFSLIANKMRLTCISLLSLVAVLSVILLFGDRPVRADNTPLSLTHNLLSSAEIFDYQITPDGSRVVFGARQSSVDPIELFSVLTTGGEVTKLSADVPIGENVTRFYISGDSKSVLYLVGAFGTFNYRMYSVSVLGGEVVDLHIQFRDDFWIHEVKFTEDNQSAVFSTLSPAMSSASLAKTLTRVAIDGSVQATQLVSVTYETESIGEWDITSDSQYVVYASGKTEGSEFDLFRVAVGGGSPVKLSGDLAVDGIVQRVFVAPSGEHVLYLTYNPITALRNLLRVSIAGGARVTINPHPVRDILLHFFLPDSRSFVYSVFDYEASSSYGFYKLFRADVDSDSSLLLSSTAETIGGYSSIEPNSFLATKNLAAFMVNATSAPGGRYAYTVPIDGGVKTKLAGPIGRESFFMVSPDESTVIYEVTEFQNLPKYLYATPITTSQPITLYHFTGYGFAREFTPDSKGVVYWINESRNTLISPYELLFIPLAGGEATKLNVALTSTQSVTTRRKTVTQAGDKTCVVYALVTLTNLSKMDALYSSCYNASVAITPTPSITATVMLPIIRK